MPPFPTNSLPNSPSWNRLTKKQQNDNIFIELCLQEISHMTELKDKTLSKAKRKEIKAKLDIVHSNISFLTE